MRVPVVSAKDPTPVHVKPERLLRTSAPECTTPALAGFTAQKPFVCNVVFIVLAPVVINWFVYPDVTKVGVAPVPS